MLVRRLARPMLSSIFVVGGFNTLRNPDHAAPAAAPVVDKLRSVLPQQVASLIPSDTTTAVRVNAGAQVVSGVLLATGKFPRVASLVLAGSLLPTTLAGHPFWEEHDPQERSRLMALHLSRVRLSEIEKQQVRARTQSCACPVSQRRMFLCIRSHLFAAALVFLLCVPVS